MQIVDGNLSDPDTPAGRIQPIAAPDVLRYLIAAVDLPAEVNRGLRRVAEEDRNIARGASLRSDDR